MKPQVLMTITSALAGSCNSSKPDWSLTPRIISVTTRVFAHPRDTK